MIKIYDAGGDWVTLTLSSKSKEFNKAVSLCEQMLKDMKELGEEITPSGLQGYAGYKAGQLFCGSRHDGMLIQATSGICKYVEEKVRASGIAFKCTRYDLQITVETKEDNQHYGQKMCAAIVVGTGAGEGETRRRVAAYQSSGDYSGVTIGARISGCFLRFYDKTLEQKGMIEPDLWRLEVEYKREKAQMVWQMSMAATRSYFLGCSLVPIEFKRVGFDVSWAGSCDGVERPTTYHKTSKDKKLGWLENHVRGSVKWLIDNGFEKDARDALGL